MAPPSSSTSSSSSSSRSILTVKSKTTDAEWKKSSEWSDRPFTGLDFVTAACSTLSTSCVSSSSVKLQHFTAAHTLMHRSKPSNAIMNNIMKNIYKTHNGHISALSSFLCVISFNNMSFIHKCFFIKRSEFLGSQLKRKYILKIREVRLKISCWFVLLIVYWLTAALIQHRI